MAVHKKRWNPRDSGGEGGGERATEGVNVFRMERKLGGSFRRKSYHAGEGKDGASRKPAVTKPGLNSCLVTDVYPLFSLGYVYVGTLVIATSSRRSEASKTTTRN